MDHCQKLTDIKYTYNILNYIKNKFFYSMNKPFLLLIMSALPITIFAQTEITVTETQRPNSKGSFNSFQVTIPQTKLKEVERDWQKYLRDGAKGKPESVNGEIIMRGAVSKNVSPNPFTVYSKLLETTGGVILTAWITEDDSVFISAELNNDKDLAAKKYVRDFAVEEYKEVVKEELKAEKKTLNNLEDELKSFINDEDKSRKKVNEHDRSIQRNRTAISTNEGDQKNKIEQITAQKKTAEALRNSPDAYKEANKTLKTYEDELKKLQKENEKMQKEIDGWQKDIRTEERSIDKSKADQKLKTEQIEKQKAVVKTVEEKLANIK